MIRNTRQFLCFCIDYSNCSGFPDPFEALATTEN